MGFSPAASRALDLTAWALSSADEATSLAASATERMGKALAKRGEGRYMAAIRGRCRGKGERCTVRADGPKGVRAEEAAEKSAGRPFLADVARLISASSLSSPPYSVMCRCTPGADSVTDIEDLVADLGEGRTEGRGGARLVARAQSPVSSPAGDGLRTRDQVQKEEQRPLIVERDADSLRGSPGSRRPRRRNH